MLRGAFPTLHDMAEAENIHKREEGRSKMVQKYRQIYKYQVVDDIQKQQEEEQRGANKRQQRLGKLWKKVQGSRKRY